MAELFFQEKYWRIVLSICFFSFQDPGVILLDPIGLGESTDGDSNDDDDDVRGNTTLSEDPSLECNFTFIGANVISGKSSIRSKPKVKKVIL